MNYVELCRQTLRASGTGTGANLVTLQGTGDPGSRNYNDFEALVARYVAEAWVRIQTLHEDWSWRIREFEARLPADTATLAWNAMRDSEGNRSIPEPPGFRRWLIQSPNDPRGLDEWYITQYDRDSNGNDQREYNGPIRAVEWRELRRLKSDRIPRVGRPQYVAETVDGLSLSFYPTPGTPPTPTGTAVGGDPAYDLSGLYRAGVQQLHEDHDEPDGLPEEYHDIVKWRAVMIVNELDEAGVSWQAAASNYRDLLDSLERVYLPTVEVGQALV